MLNVASILRRHSTVHDKLAAAMLDGKSVSQCIVLLEQQLAGVEDV